MRILYLLPSIMVVSMLALSLAPVYAARPPWVFPAGCCYYNDVVVRTVVPPNASFPQEGTDPFYAITNGVSGQKPVVAVAPGDIGYNGGHWKFHAVTFNQGETPYLLTSASAVLAAQNAGDVTVTRIAQNDFLCPIQF